LKCVILLSYLSVSLSMPMNAPLRLCASVYHLRRNTIGLGEFDQAVAHLGLKQRTQADTRVFCHWHFYGTIHIGLVERELDACKVALVVGLEALELLLAAAGDRLHVYVHE